MVHHLVKIERRLLSHHEEFSRILTRCRWARQSPEDDLLFEVLGERFQGFHRTAKQWAAGIQIIPLGLRPVWTENGNEGRERGGEDCDIVVSVSDDRGRGGTSTWRRNDESDDQQLTQDTNLENLNNDEIAATSHVRRALEGTEFWALILNYILKIKAERSHFWDLRDFKVKAEQRRRYWEHERIKRERWSREDTKLRVNNPRSVLVWLKAERSKVETPRIAWKDVLLRTQYSHYIQTGVDYGDEDTEDEDEGVRKANMEERKGNEEERKGNEGVYEWNVDRRDYWAVVSLRLTRR